MVPVVESVEETGRKTLREWLRTFFNFLWKWQGGHGRVPWTWFGKDNSNVYIEKARMPQGVDVLQDPHSMTRAILQAWYRHIVAGQLGKLTELQIFQFRQVDRSDGAPIIFTTLCVHKPTSAALKYSPEQKLYAMRVAKAVTVPEGRPSWKGLPLARAFGIFEALDEEVALELQKLGTDAYPLQETVQLLKRMEELGPVHTIDPSMTELPSALCSIGLPEDNIWAFIGNNLLPVPFFDIAHEDHDWYALATLASWLKGHNRFRHQESGIWRGGPKGVRWVVIALARIITTMITAESSMPLPGDLRKAIIPGVFLQQKQQVAGFCRWLNSSLKETISVLSRTFVERRAAWKSAVASAHLKNQILDGNNEPVLGGRTTNGVPLDPQELSNAYLILSASDPDITLGEGNDLLDGTPSVEPQARTRRPRPKPCYRKASESSDTAEDSGSNSSEGHESIDIDDNDLSSSEDEELDRTLVNMQIQSKVRANRSLIDDHTMSFAEKSVHPTGDPRLNPLTTDPDSTKTADTAQNMDNSDNIDEDDRNNDNSMTGISILPADLSMPKAPVAGMGQLHKSLLHLTVKFQRITSQSIPYTYLAPNNPGPRTSPMGSRSYQ
ncbi:hypothetical protein RhiJN_15062 [Ceratobasidium sp. AG-Ba]|nr:hypothetical protein RhiJN_15062 [Ceratobasidium sp. AG-Ba]